MRIFSHLLLFFFCAFIALLTDIPRTILIGVFILGSGLLSKVLKRKEHVLHDADAGEIISYSDKGEKMEWLAYFEILEAELEVPLNGNASGLSEKSRRKFLSLRQNEKMYIAESKRVLKEAFMDADLVFIDIQHHFIPVHISIEAKETVLTYEERNSGHHFNVYFSEKGSTGYSIDT